ncbi:unnamed protein product [Rotaria sordida]|uniref:Uncharacterized protein n=1 Tax=Rotaria sordida TaxID=392033 RepID=A0A815DQ39_9BILA|nr:unnamed protein product [Rotaria sordida]
MTHNKRGEPLHFNINIWQLQSAINDSNGLCAGPTCSSKARHNLYRNYQRSSYPTGVIVLICNIYIGNYLKSMAPQPWERSLHYNRTIENVQKACRADIQIQDWPHAAAGSLESQPTTLSTSTSRITSTMTSVTFTSTGTLPPTSIIIITTTTESPKTQTMTNLYLSGENIGNLEAEHLAEALQNNITLEILNLSYNKIDDRGVQHIANAIQNSKTLTKLELRGNQIGDIGAECLANVLINNNTTLTMLGLKENRIRYAGLQHLAKALQNNTTLRTIDLIDNEISDEEIQSLVETYENDQLNEIMTTGAHSLYNTLTINTVAFFFLIDYHIPDFIVLTQTLIRLRSGENDMKHPIGIVSVFYPRENEGRAETSFN